jgi:hypothetical protein
MAIDAARQATSQAARALESVLTLERFGTSVGFNSRSIAC